MVAPIGDFALRGVLWYQGESNTGEPHTYEALLRALMRQWRQQWGEHLPILVVQLANFGIPPASPGESGWAEVREAQRRATRDDPGAATVVAIDLGDVYDIHPPNKQEVGRRLGRAARHLLLDDPVSAAGPIPTHASRVADGIRITFDGITGDLFAYGHTNPIGFEVCEPDAGSCRYVDARIDNDRIVLMEERPETITRVRYCWADSPICTLYDTSRLPVGPFEIEVTG
jgi:sialate O-acetylesterase